MGIEIGKTHLPPEVVPKVVSFTDQYSHNRAVPCRPSVGRIFFGGREPLEPYPLILFLVRLLLVSLYVPAQAPSGVSSVTSRIGFSFISCSIASVSSSFDNWSSLMACCNCWVKTGDNLLGLFKLQHRCKTPLLNKPHALSCPWQHVSGVPSRSTLPLFTT